MAGTKSRFDEIKPDRGYTPTQFCELVGIKRQTLGEWRRKKGFPVRDTGKDGLILGSDVLEWMRNRPLRNGGAETAT